MNTRRVTRPEFGAVDSEFVEALWKALDELGVQPGEQFIVAKPKSVDQNVMGPFQAHSKTSRQAAIDNYPRQGSQREKVLRYVVGCGDSGATREEIAADMAMTESSVRPRIVELLDGGYVKASGRTRKTARKNAAEILVATDHGRDEYRLRHSSDLQKVADGEEFVVLPSPLFGAG